MSERCKTCAYERTPNGLTSPPFFGPKPPDMEPCDACWKWKAEEEARQEARRPKFTQADIDAAVAEATKPLTVDAIVWAEIDELRKALAKERKKNERLNAEIGDVLNRLQAAHVLLVARGYNGDLP